MRNNKQTKKMQHLSFVLLFVSYFVYECQTLGTTINGYKGYNTLEIGNMNLFITAPHNGALAPADIPDRRNVTDEGVVLSDFAYLTDLNTKSMAKVIRDELVALFKLNKNIDATPHLLYTNLMRYI